MMIISKIQTLIASRMKHQTDLAFAISKHALSTHANTSHSVFSPLSVNVLLGFIGSGSKGATLRQSLSFLNSNSTDYFDPFSPELTCVVLADGTPLDDSFSLKPSFKQVVSNVFKAASYNVGFRTKAAELTDGRNGWAGKGTNGLIKEKLYLTAI